MKLIKLLTCVIFALALFSVTISNRSLDHSLELTVISKEIEVLERDLTVLKATVAEEGSLASLESRLKDTGFISPSQIIAVGVLDHTVASR